MTRIQKILHWNPTEETQVKIRNALIRVSFYCLACMIFLWIGSERESYAIKQELKLVLLDKKAAEEENKQWIQNYYELANQASHLGKRIEYMRFRHEKQIDELRAEAEVIRNNFNASQAEIKKELAAATNKLQILENEVGLTKKQVNALNALKK